MVRLGGFGPAGFQKGMQGYQDRERKMASEDKKSQLEEDKFEFDKLKAMYKVYEDSKDKETKILAAQQKQTLETDKLNLEKKKLKLKREEFEAKGTIDPVTAAIFGLEEEKQKVQEKEIDLSKLQSTEAGGIEQEKQYKLTKEAEQIKKKMQTRQQMQQILNNPNYNATYSAPVGKGGARISVRQKANQAKASTKVSSSDKVLGNLEMGGVYDESIDGVSRFKNKEEAIEYAQGNLGYGWQKKFPEAKTMIDKMFKGSYEVGEIKTVTGKGKYKYIGEDQWQKVN